MVVVIVSGYVIAGDGSGGITFGLSKRAKFSEMTFSFVHPDIRVVSNSPGAAATFVYENDRRRGLFVRLFSVVRSKRNTSLGAGALSIETLLSCN